MRPRLRWGEQEVLRAMMSVITGLDYKSKQSD